MDQRYWVKHHSGDRVQTFWSNGSISVMVAGDRHDALELIEMAASEHGCRLPEPDTSGPMPVMPGQLELVA